MDQAKEYTIIHQAQSHIMDQAKCMQQQDSKEKDKR